MGGDIQTRLIAYGLQGKRLKDSHKGAVRHAKGDTGPSPDDLLKELTALSAEVCFGGSAAEEAAASGPATDATPATTTPHPPTANTRSLSAPGRAGKSLVVNNHVFDMPTDWCACDWCEDATARVDRIYEAWKESNTVQARETDEACRVAQETINNVRSECAEDVRESKAAYNKEADENDRLAHELSRARAYIVVLLASATGWHPPPPAPVPGAPLPLP